ncbi:hypothetical protein [Hymenobacter guriensis]|uniref:DUF4476 domain-containing protein n=1 Tax=Hymenobacter guriensis TaxID=2793065 RepID=A0ABS0L3Q9_9BACT|nr:hypothetical protein [Hymenobacter guriensis]MBG8554752.1 hypothetical protein [Hymenobacter guriensis]
MKQTTYYRFTWLSVLLVGLLVLSACKKEEATGCSPYVPPTPADTYVFPVQPGTPAWASLTSGDEMVEVCQVPAARLQTISTPGLITTCLNYPLLGDMIFFDNLQFGLRTQLSNFNGFGELQQRPEAAALLLARYQSMRPACIPSTEPVEIGDYAFDFSDIEMILAQDEYLQQLSPAQRRMLVQVALEKYAAKQVLVEDVYGLFGLKTAAFVMARTMQAENYAPFMTALAADTKLKMFVEQVDLSSDPTVLDTVVDHAKQFN